MAKLRYSKEVSEKDKRTFKKYLSEDEELVVATGYGRTYLRQRFIIQLVLPGAVFIVVSVFYCYFKKTDITYGLIGGFLAAILWSFFQTWLIYNAHRYILTTRRVILKQGIFNVKVASALYDKITHIEVDQSLIDRMFLHHGMVIINTAGANKDELVLKYVENPVEFKNVLERLIHQEREYFRRNTERLEPIEGQIIS